MCCFQDFFFIFGFQQVDYDVSACPFWGFSQTLISAHLWLSPNVRNFQLYFFLVQSLFPLLLEFQWHKCKAYSTAPWDSTHFFFTFIFVPLVQKGLLLLIYFLVQRLLSPLFMQLLSSLSTVFSYILY